MVQIQIIDLFQVPENAELLYTDSQYEYYKVTVAKGTRMIKGKVPETCEAAGLRAVCPGSTSCQFTDQTKCDITPLSISSSYFSGAGCRYL